MRASATSNKRNSSSSSVGSAQGQHQRKSAKGSTSSSSSKPDVKKQHLELDGDDDDSLGEFIITTDRHQLSTTSLIRDVVPSSMHSQCTELNNRVGDSLGHHHGAQQAYNNNSMVSPDDYRKQNHCEIEKRRRDKMNQYIMELASVIPSFNNNQSKLDKLTVLRMAVQHVKSLRSSLCSFSSFHLRPSFLSSGNLLKNLILQMASQEAQDNLFMVVSCDRGKVLFVSQSSKNILNQEQHELTGQCLFDILHKDDVSKVKEQISYFNLMPKQMLIDSKTLQPIKHTQRQSFSQLQNQSNSTPQPGARRSFFCRMKSGKSASRAQSDSSSGKSPASHSSSLSSLSALSSTSSAYFSSPSSSSTSTTAHRIERERRRHHSSSAYVDRCSIQVTNNCVDNDSKAAQQYPVNFKSNNMSGVACTSQVEDINQTTKNGPKTIANEQIRNNDNHNNENSTTNNNAMTGQPTNGSDNIGGTTKNIRTISRARRSKSYSSTSSNSSGVASSSGGGSSNSSRGGSSSGSSGSSISGIHTNDQSFSEESPPSIDKMVNERIESKGNRVKTTPVSSDKSSGSSGNISNSGGGRGGSSGSKKHWRYTVMHCTGYLKALTLKGDEFDDDDFDDCNSDINSDDDENDGTRTINCLVAVCRRSPLDRDLKPDRPLTFTCRYSMEGKFVFVDQRTTVALGYTPQQLLGTSHYAYCHKDSVNTFKECHRQSILKSEPVSSDIYQFKRANGQHLWLQTSLKSFRNPWTKFIDYIVANHTTAEGNDPHYNEGCVPTKFNQDMTAEASQSSSPASSSSLSLPSMDSKKSSSPSSSSIGSSYSMDSYASGESVQALLNQIDRVKSGGIKHALEFSRKKGSGHHELKSSGGHTRKNRENSVNYSDPQSCSSLSSQNSAQSNDYFNIQGTNALINNSSNRNNSRNSSVGNLSNSTTNGEINAFRTVDAQYLCLPTNNYQTISQQQQQIATTNQEISNQVIKNSAKTVARVGLGSVRSPACSNPHQRHYTDHQFSSRSHEKGGSLASTDTGIGTTWSNSSGSIYSSSSSHRGNNRQDIEPNSALINQDSLTRVVKDNQPSSGPSDDIDNVVSVQGLACPTIDKLQHARQPTSYNVQPVDAQQMNMVATQLPMQNHISNSYTTELIPINPYINQKVGTSYNNGGVEAGQIQQMPNSDLQTSITTMTTQQHHQQQQRMPQQVNNPNQSSVHMIWSTDNQYQNPNTMHDTNEQNCVGEDMTLMNVDVGNSANQMIAQQVVPYCLQCVNHKCSNQQSINNLDLNSINLTSLAVGGDLDEDQLLEYLTSCPQLNNTQNTAYPQYNNYDEPT